MVERFHSSLPINEEVLEGWLGQPLTEKKKKELGLEDQELPIKTTKYGGTD
jgi:hypothetical protein